MTQATRLTPCGRTLITTGMTLAFGLTTGTANAQFIARKLVTNGARQEAVAVSGNRAVGTFGSSNVRLREDAMLWDIRDGVPTFPEFPMNSAYRQISGDWVIRSHIDFSIIQVTSNTSFIAKNLVTAATVDLGISASANNSQTYVSVSPNLRENWAFTNTDQRAIAFGPYNMYSSRAINLTTGEQFSFSWNVNGDPFTYINRKIVDVSGGQALVNATATGFGFLDLPSGAITDINTGLDYFSVVGMSGNYIAGTDAITHQAALYDTAAGITRTLGAMAGLSVTGPVGIGANQTIGNGYTSGNQNGRALLWDNATGAATNLHGFLPSGYAVSSAVSIDKSFADGPVLVNATKTTGETDQYALRRLSGALNGISSDEIATFEEDHTQTDGIVANAGTIRWTNPPHTWNLQGGLLTGTGFLGGSVNNTGGTLSGGMLGSGGGSGGSGGSGGGGGFGGGSGGGSGIGSFTAGGGYFQGANGILLVTFGSPIAFDTFTFGGSASLSGLLEVTLLDGFTPTLGQTFRFFNAPNTTGAWDRIFSPGSFWDVNYDTEGATLVYRGIAGASAAPEPTTLSLLALGVFGFIGCRRRR